MTTTTLFVTGASRSGTTMLNRILGNHSQILGLRELHYFGDIWNVARHGQGLDLGTIEAFGALLNARQSSGMFGREPAESDHQFGRELAGDLVGADGLSIFLEATRRFAVRAGKQIACEQTPRNIYYAKELLELDPGIRIIQLVRDPRSVAASQKNRWRRKQLGGTNVPWSEVVRTWSNYHPRTMAGLWQRAERCGSALRGHSRFHLIRFEDLVREPEAAVRSLCGFVGVDFQPQMLDVPVVGSSQGRDQGERGISTQGIDTWRKVLAPCEARLIEELCTTSMLRQGYTLSQPNCSALGALSIGLRYPLHLVASGLSNPRRAWIQAKALLAR